MSGRSAFTRASTSAPALSARLLLSAAKLFCTAFLIRRMYAVPYRGSRRAETLSSMSLHVSAKIQAFCLASHVFALGTALRRAAKSSSILVGFTGGLTGHRFRPPRYRFVSDRGALGRQPRTM